MIKLLFFVGLGVVVYLLLTKGRSAAKTSTPAEKPPNAGDVVTAQAAEAMVRCAYCGLNIPASEGLVVAQRHYCGEEHRQLDESKRSQ